MPRIIIVKGIKELEEKFKKLGQKNLGKRTAKKLAERIEQNMKIRVPYWRGDLYNSIKTIPFEDGFAISMNFYGRFVESGHKITAVVPTLKHWAFTKLSKPERFFRMIIWSNLRGSPYFAKPHPFTEDSVNEAIGSFDQIADFVVKQTFRESGFNEK